MTEAAWLALQQFAAGILPRWKARDSRGARAARQVVCDMIERVQQSMQGVLQAWRSRAAGGVSFERERAEKADWLRLVLRAWKGTGGQHTRESSDDRTCISVAGNRSMLSM